MSDVPASPTGGAARVAIVGSGPLADEVARNLGLAGIPVAVHGPADFWTTLRLADLQDCYCAVAAGPDAEAHRRLNRLCQVASVDFVSVALVGQGLVVESFPFGSDTGCACLGCEAPPAAAGAGPAPDPIAASIAGALAAATALQCANYGARRLSLAEPTDGGATIALRRRAGCPDCAPPWRAPRVIRTRNRWLARDPFARDAAALAGQLVRLSDPLVTAWVCASCGSLPMAAGSLDAPPAACPGCGGSLRIEATDIFTLGDLMDRIGAGALPVKFAVADIGGTAVCFDLEAGSATGPSSRR